MDLDEFTTAALQRESEDVRALWDRPAPAPAAPQPSPEPQEGTVDDADADPLPELQAPLSPLGAASMDTWQPSTVGDGGTDEISAPQTLADPLESSQPPEGTPLHEPPLWMPEQRADSPMAAGDNVAAPPATGEAAQSPDTIPDTTDGEPLHAPLWLPDTPDVSLPQGPSHEPLPASRPSSWESRSSDEWEPPGESWTALADSQPPHARISMPDDAPVVALPEMQTAWSSEKLQSQLIDSLTKQAVPMLVDSVAEMGAALRDSMEQQISLLSGRDTL